MKRVKIFGLEIPVKKVKNLVDHHGWEGYYDDQQKLIVVDQRLKGEDFQATLIHEMVHALFRRAGLVQSKIPLEAEEIIAEQFATMMCENFVLKPK